MSGGVVFDSAGETFPSPAPSDDDVVLAAFLRRYRFSGGCTGLPGVRLNRLVHHLRATLPGMERQISRFIRRHFHCRTQSSKSLRGLPRRVVTCHPRDGSSVVPQ
eukprot:3936427-Rhodomonas_salina.1